MTRFHDLLCRSLRRRNGIHSGQYYESILQNLGQMSNLGEFTKSYSQSLENTTFQVSD